MCTGMKVLVTAGPTWVALDKVRVITSVFTGNTGLSIARAFAASGAEVTLLLGPGMADLEQDDEESMRIVRFRYLDELASLLESELDGDGYDVIVHSAAVADYAPAEVSDEKIPSGFDELQITLKPTRKLVEMIRGKAPDAFLVQFKLETGKPGEELIEAAWRGLMDTGGNLVVANLLEEITEDSHKAYIVDPAKQVQTVDDKADLAARLVDVVSANRGERA
jgi:phosphopantothenoylcysteine synthetase/decarboxylase